MITLSLVPEALPIRRGHRAPRWQFGRQNRRETPSVRPTTLNPAKFVIKLKQIQLPSRRSARNFSSFVTFDTGRQHLSIHQIYSRDIHSGIPARLKRTRKQRERKKKEKKRKKKKKKRLTPKPSETRLAFYIILSRSAKKFPFNRSCKYESDETVCYIL